MKVETNYIHTEQVHNTRAAEQIVPYLMKLFNPSSVLDVGCGTGTWLKVFSTNTAVRTLVGIDGEYIETSKLVMPVEWLVKYNLVHPFCLKRKFDMVISLEVAEHLPESAAAMFIENLVKHGGIIVFSAAIPGQVGQNHINEQWQSYWAEKFSSHGYYAYDLVRPHFWNNPLVDAWYRQNILIYSLYALPYPKAVHLDIVHPDMWSQKIREIDRFENKLSMIREGRTGIFFPVKTLLKSLARLGIKSYK